MDLRYNMDGTIIKIVLVLGGVDLDLDKGNIPSSRRGRPTIRKRLCSSSRKGRPRLSQR